MTRTFRSLALAAVLAAPLAGAALAQEAGGSFIGTPERDVTTQAPREFSARRASDRNTVRDTQVAPTQTDRHAVPSSFNSTN